MLAIRIAAMQHCGMTTLPLSKRGSLTLPPALRRKLGLDKLRNPMLLVEEREGGVFLHPATAVPVRDIPNKKIQAWIARDEAEMKVFLAAGKKRK
jgi:bifunctional DNA-binding transcriptional regulator/antitoxin component of YhaV-PrlF toxin-antitoxin module